MILNREKLQVEMKISIFNIMSMSAADLMYYE